MSLTGLIGKNGVGKTTLLKYIANFDIPGFPTHHRILHVKQGIVYIFYRSYAHYHHIYN